MTTRRRGRRVAVFRLFRVWGPAAALMAAFFVVSAMPGPPRLPGAVSDVTAHFLAYGLLGAAMLRGVTGAEWARTSLRGALLAAALGAAYGLTDELHQAFVPGRSPELRDAAADALGSAAGAGLVWAWSIVLAVRGRRHAG